MSDGPFKNTDTEIWRREPGDFYSPSISVTKEGAIQLHVGGTVITKSIEDWHGLADTVTGWQDISTAPKGDDEILVGWHCEHTGRFIWVKAGQIKGVWYISGSTGTVCYPTHYFTLPPAPKEEK